MRHGWSVTSGLTAAPPSEEGTDAPSPEPGVRPVYEELKAWMDRALALVLILLAAPAIAAAAVVLSCTSPGPVFYSQMRLGRGGRLFRIYKLRTMVDRSEATTGPVWSIAGDPRITRVGMWLRDTHLDEVPQLWNVLRGDMSLIGPRPERPEIALTIERTLPEFRERLRVRPGITGLAQVLLPPDADLDTVQRKLVHDLQYISNIGPRLDALIAIATVLHCVGAAITAASRSLVRPFAPTRPSVMPSMPPELSLRGSTDDLGAGMAAVPIPVLQTEGFSRAA